MRPKSVGGIMLLSALLTLLILTASNALADFTLADFTLAGDGLAENASLVRRPSTQSTTLLASSQSDPVDGNDLWDDRFGIPGITCCVGFSFDIYTAETGPDGIYVGGSFQQVGGKRGTRGVARWDGRRWHSLDNGVLKNESLGGDVYDIAIDGDNVYVVGDFDLAGGQWMYGVARWHIPSQEWFAVGNGTGPATTSMFGDFEPAPNAVAVVEGDVYVGGYFDKVDDVFARRIARWDGQTWSSLAYGVYLEDTAGNDAVVRTIAGVDGIVYVGGEFAKAINPDGVADVAVNHLAAWDPATNLWADVGGGTSYKVRTLTAHGDALYVGGGFYRAGGNTVNGIAKWQNNTWSALDMGVDGYVDSIKVVGEDVYVSGGFVDASDVADTDSLARWDGTQWNPLETSDFFLNPSENYISALGVFQDGRILVGGEFGDYSPRLFQNVAFWNGDQWHGTGLGFEDDSTAYAGADGYAVAVAPNGHVFVGGDFEHIGGLPHRHIAMWDGTQWNDLNGGVSGDVSILLLRGDDLYVGGGFATVGDDIAATRVAKWNIPTQTWSAVGSGLPGGYVNDMAFVGETLFAGGSRFPYNEDCCLWKWNPDQNDGVWQPFSEQYKTDYFVSAICCAQSSVHALASDGERLMVGGFWTDVDERASLNTVVEGDLFVYDPATDSVAGFGTGIDGPSLVEIDEIAITHSGVYIGGDFTSIDGVAASHLARLTEDGWSGMDVSVLGDSYPTITAIVPNGNELYVAGSFEQVGIEAFNIARLDLTTGTWSELGCGITRNNSLGSQRVQALAVQPQGLPNAGLYVAGGIARAGCIPSAGFAAWYGIGPENDSPQGQPRIPSGPSGEGSVEDRALFLPLIQ